MLFVLAFISIFSSSAYSQLDPFEEVAKKADAIIERMDANEQVDGKEVKKVTGQLIEHIVSNLGKDASWKQSANYFVSAEDMEHSLLLKGYGLRVIETKEFRVFNRSMDYLKKMPIDFWGEDLVDRLEEIVYNQPEGTAKDWLAKGYGKITIMNVAFELAEINARQKLPDHFYDFFSSYYYNHALLALFYALDDLSVISRSYEARKDNFKLLLADIAAYYARLVLVEDYVNRRYVNEDINEFSLYIDFDKYFGDIKTYEINNYYDKEPLIEIINSMSGKKYFDPLRYEEGASDHHRKEAERATFKKRANAYSCVFNVTDKINAYLPEDLRSTDIHKAMDNLALYVVKDLNGVLGEKEDILLFGEYTEGGRLGGVFGKMVAMNESEMIILFGSLAYANRFCDNREVLMTVNSGFKIAGVMSSKGALNREKFEMTKIEKRFGVKFSYGMMKIFNKGVDLIKM